MVVQRQEEMGAVNLALPQVHGIQLQGQGFQRPLRRVKLYGQRLQLQGCGFQFQGHRFKIQVRGVQLPRGMSSITIPFCLEKDLTSPGKIFKDISVVV